MPKALLGLLLACAACASAPELPPRAAELNLLGAQALAEGDLEAADARLSLALEYSPEFVEALTNLGLVEIRRGNFARAEQLLQRSRRLNPDIAQTHHALGVLDERRYRRDLAGEHYREALAVDPGFVEARANLARLLFEDRKHEHALVQYRLLVAAAPERDAGWFGLGSVLLSLGRLDEVDALLKECGVRFPDSPEFALLAGRFELLRGEHESAERHLLPLSLPLSPFTVPALGWLGVSLLARGRADETIELAGRALELEPDDPLATYVLAVALDEASDPSAGAWLERALLSNPGHIELQARLKRRGKAATRHAGTPLHSAE